MLGGQEFLDSAGEAVSSSFALFQLLLEVEAHQIFAGDDADDAVDHVDDGEVPQAECPKDDVRPMQRKLVFDTRRGTIDVRLL